MNFSYTRRKTRRSFSVTAGLEEKKVVNTRGSNNLSGKNVKYDTVNEIGCNFCGKSGHISLFDCEGFKNADITARCRFVVSQRLCWRCLKKGHIARRCTNKEIKACDRYLHSEIACPCDYRGKKFISGSASVNRSLNNFCKDRKGVRLPILPIKVYTARGQKRVYALIDTGSEETLISKKL